MSTISISAEGVLAELKRQQDEAQATTAEQEFEVKAAVFFSAQVVVVAECDTSL